MEYAGLECESGVGGAVAYCSTVVIDGLGGETKESGDVVGVRDAESYERVDTEFGG